MRLWRVIQRLTQWKGFNMTDKEEAVFGLVYQAFKKTRRSASDAQFYASLPIASRESVKSDRIEDAARALRQLFDLNEVR